MKKLPKLGAELLIKTLDGLETGSVKSTKQNYEEASNSVDFENNKLTIRWF